MVRFADGAPAVTDDRSVVDFTSPRRARANFGLGEWVTGGLTAAGVGELGLRSELGLREFDRAYAFRDSPLPLVASYGSQRPADVRRRAARAGRPAGDEGGGARDRQRAPATPRTCARWASGSAASRSSSAACALVPRRGERAAARDAGAAAAGDGPRERGARRRRRAGRGPGGAAVSRRSRRREHVRSRAAPAGRGPVGPAAPAGTALAASAPCSSSLPWLRLLLARAAAARRRLRRAADLVAAPARRGRDAPAEQPALHVALLRPGRRAAVPALLAPAAQAAGHAAASSCSGSSAAQGDPEPAFGLARHARGAAARPVPRRRVRGRERRRHRRQLTLRVPGRARVPAARAGPARVYAGNNEVVGPFGAGTVLTRPPRPTPLVRASLAAQRTRLGQLAGSRFACAARAARAGATRPVRGTAWRCSSSSRCAATTPRSSARTATTSANLADTCRLARAAGVPVVLSTVAVNLRSCGPFASLNATSLDADARARWDALFGEGVRLEAEGRWAESRGPLAEAIALDPGHAESLYRLGRCELRLGREAAAREHLSLARDLDTLRFRADTRTNAIVREVAGREGARAWRTRSRRWQPERRAPCRGTRPSSTTSTSPSRGNYRLAVCPARAGPRRAARACSSARRDGPCRRSRKRRAVLVYTELDRYRIAETMQQRLRDAPFTDQPDHAEHVRRFADELAALRARGDAGAVDAALAQYEQALAAGPAHWTLRERYAVDPAAARPRGRRRRAVAVARAGAAAVPRVPAAARARAARRRPLRGGPRRAAEGPRLPARRRR